MDPLTHNEIIIIRGVLDMREKKVSQIMTPLEKAFMVIMFC
jgi:CBS domain containing-hemolysin-like protein